MLNICYILIESLYIKEDKLKKEMGILLNQEVCQQSGQKKRFSCYNFHLMYYEDLSYVPANLADLT